MNEENNTEEVVENTDGEMNNDTMDSTENSETDAEAAESHPDQDVMMDSDYQNAKSQEDHTDGAIVEEVPKEYHPIFPGKDFENQKTDYFKVSTIPILVTLIVIFFIIKKFIYIPDDKRDGK